MQAFVANPVDSDDVQAVSQRLRDLQLCAQKLRREQEQLPALNLRFQAELTEEQELEADIVNADDLDTQLELNLLQLDDAISLLKPGSSLPPPRLSVSSPPPSVATDAQPGFTSADVSSVHVRLPKLMLPTFSGDPLDWQSFWDTFAASVHSNTSLSGVQKFQYLRGQLTGAAARCIAGLTATNQHYTHAVELLRQRFGQPHKITSAHMEALIHMAPPSASHRDLRSFFDRVSCHVRGLEAAGRTANSYGDCLVPILLERLPATTRQQLTRDHGTTEWEIGALLAALRKEIEILELGPSLDDATPQPTMNFATMARCGQRQGSASRSSRTPRCAFCDRPHPSSQCSTVTDPQQRRDTVKSKGLCFNCLGPHRVSTCPTKVRCRTCGQKHHTTLCMPQQPPTQRSHATVASSTAPQPQPDQPGQSAQPAQPTPASHVACATSVHPAACLAAGQSVILQTASTTVYAEQGNRSASVRLLLDSGSQRTYMSRRLAESLHLQPALHEPLSISTFGDTRPFTVDTYLVNFQLGLKDGSRLDVNANVIPDITGSIYRGSTPPEDEAFLRDLSPGMLADCLPSDQDDAKVDLLIGSDLFWDLVSSDRIVLPSGLLLLSSKLGYILTGKCNTAQPAKEVGTLIAHTPVLQSGLIPTYTACADSCVSSSPNLTDFWSLETIGIKDDPSPSPDDQIGQDFENSVRFEDGRYEVRWPWKDNAADNNITWHFITEHAPWQGGFYERLVGLCKRALRKSINRRLLHLSDLTTLVTEVEATLNSRPLTYVDQDVDGGVTITPAHFLSLSPAPRLSLPSGADVAETADAQLYLPATDPAEELRRTWQASMTTLEYFWSIWEREYLQLLRQTTISRQHYQHSTVNRTPQVNDIVIVKSDEQPRASWKLGRVMAVNQSHDTLIRSARVLMPNHRVLTRPVNQLFPLELHCVSQPAPAQPAPDSTSSAATRPARSAALDAQRRLADLFCDTSS